MKIVDTMEKVFQMRTNHINKISYLLPEILPPNLR